VSVSMPFYEFTNQNAVQLLATQTRRIDITPYALTQTHIELGKYMAFQICKEFELEDCTIIHPQGIKKGKQIANEEQIVILGCLRAGIYLVEGLRFIFQKSPVYYIHPIRNVGLEEKELKILPSLKNRSVIIADSVINTGETIFPTIKQIECFEPLKIIVTCLVMPLDTAEKIKRNHTSHSFYVARVSRNKYVGKGKTDTGNRLFGTF